jgi:hypothetical protein
MFGKDRASYIKQNVISDDEDMEVDARFLEKEELRRSVIPPYVSFFVTLHAEPRTFTVHAWRGKRKRPPWKLKGATKKIKGGGKWKRNCKRSVVDAT